VQLFQLPHRQHSSPLGKVIHRIRLRLPSQSSHLLEAVCRVIVVLVPQQQPDYLHSRCKTATKCSHWCQSEEAWSLLNLRDFPGMLVLLPRQDREFVRVTDYASCEIRRVRVDQGITVLNDESHAIRQLPVSSTKLGVRRVKQGDVVSQCSRASWETRSPTQHQLRQSIQSLRQLSHKHLMKLIKEM
jgi:hypothetical protein